MSGDYSSYANWLRYINCPRSRSEENVGARQVGHHIEYYTLRPIAAGEELMVWYGPEYGQLLTGKAAL